MNGWPIGTAPAVVSAAVECKAQHAELAAMLRRANVFVGSAAIASGDAETRDRALVFLRESTALLKRATGR